MVFSPASHPIHLAMVAWILSNQAALAETPEYSRRLIDEAGVSFAFYDPVQEPRVHRGYTAFRLDMFYDASFQYRWEDGAAGRSVTIQTRIGNIRYRLSNRVELPQHLDKNDRWNDSLVRHEFDHVAMTVDPRVRMLFEHLCRKVTPITRRLPLASPINDAVVKAIIHEEVERRCNAVIDLLIASEHAAGCCHEPRFPPARRPGGLPAPCSWNRISNPISPTWPRSRTCCKPRHIRAPLPYQ